MCLIYNFDIDYCGNHSTSQQVLYFIMFTMINMLFQSNETESDNYCDSNVTLSFSVEIIHQYVGDKVEVHKEEKDFILGEGCLADIPEGLEIALQKFNLKEKSIIYLKNKYAEEVKKSLKMSTSDDEIKYELTLLQFEKV